MARQTQAERTEATRAALLRAARALFAERGVADTSLDDITVAAGVTRGALYHHFESKAALAVAVVEGIDAELAARVVKAASSTNDPAEQLRRSSRAYVEACAEPSIARLLLEAPLVLGPETLRAMNEAVCVRMLEPVLAQLPNVADPAVEARLLLGMLDAASFLVAAEPRRKRKVVAGVDAFLDRLLD